MSFTFEELDKATQAPDEGGFEFDLDTGIPVAEEEEMSSLSEQSDSLGGFWSGLYQADHANLGRMAEAGLPMGRFYFGDIPWTPQKERFITHKSTYEILGITEDEWDTLSHSERVKLLNEDTQKKVHDYYKPDVNSAAYMFSKFTGSLTSPSTAIAIVSPKSLAALGGIDASLYEYGTTGELSPTTPLIGAGLGYAGGKVAGKLQKRADVKKANQVVDQLQTEINSKVVEGVNPLVVLNQAKKSLNLSDDIINEALNLSQRKLAIKGRKGAKAALEVNRAKRQGKTGKTIDYVVEPLSEQIKRISPRLYGRLNQAAREVFEENHRHAMMVDPFLKGIKKLSKEDQHVVHTLMLNSKGKKDVKGIEKFLREKTGKETLVNDYRLYREAIDDITKQRRLAGESLGAFDGYHPRRVSDYDLWFSTLGQKERALVDKFIEYRAKKDFNKKVADLSEKERVKLINQYLKTSQGHRAVESITSAHKRKISEVSPQLAHAYEDPWNTTHKFIKESQDVIEKYKLFGSKNVKTKEGDIDIDGTIGAFVERERKAGRLHDADIDEMKKLLAARFSYGPQQMNKHLQNLKNVGYMTLLGHPTNAIRQFGDLALSAYQNGIVNTTKGAWQTMTGKGLTAKEAGLLDNIAAEFASDTVTKRALDFSFKYSGFKSVDALGKGALMNSSLFKSANRLKSKAGELEFRNKWSSVLGAEDTSQVIKEFKAWKRGAKPTRLMKDTAFMDLANIQPVTLLEMPEAYLKSPNGRMFYMLKTFMLKHINLMRQDVAKEFTQGSKTKALKNLALLSSYFTLGNMGVDKINDLILGRDTKLDETFVTNLYRNTGILSRYDVEQLVKSGDAYGFALDFMTPPMDPVAKETQALVHAGYNLVQGDRWNKGMGKKESDVYSGIPIFGRLMKAWLD